MTTAKTIVRRSQMNCKAAISRARVQRTVAEVAAEHTGVSIAEITGTSQERRVVAARWEVWRRLVGPNDSIASLARVWGVHRTTIMNGLNRLAERERVKLIGITGTKGSGKDTAADALEGFENVKMAGPLKLMLRGLLEYQGLDQETIGRMIDGDLKEVPTPFLGGRTPRYAMVTIGTEWGRDLMDKDLWIAIAANRIGQFERVVVSDVRFPNEVEMVKRLGGEVFRVERAGAAAADPHPSEAQIATLDVDGVLPNVFASREAFQGYVRAELL